MTETTTTKRATKAEKKFLHADGTLHAHASPDAVALVIKFANGQDLTIDPSSFNATVAKCFLLHGMSQKLGDSYAGAETAEAAYDKAANLAEAMSGENGQWLQKGEAAGPRVSILAEAVMRAKPEKYPTVESAVAMLQPKTKEERAAIAAIPAVEAASAAIRAERAVKAAQKAAEAAGQSTAEEVDF